MPRNDATLKMPPDEYWVCDICKRRLKKELWVGGHFPSAGANLIEGHKERFCFQCWGNGIMWAIKRANKLGK